MKSKIFFVGLVTVMILSGCDFFQKNKVLTATDNINSTSSDDFCLTFVGSADNLQTSSRNKFCTKNGDMVFDQVLDDGTKWLNYCIKNESYTCDSAASPVCAKIKAVVDGGIGGELCGYGSSIVKPAYSDIWQSNPVAMKAMPSKKIAGIDTDCYQLDMDQIPPNNVAGITSYEVCYYPKTQIVFYSKYNFIAGTSISDS